MKKPEYANITAFEISENIASSMSFMFADIFNQRELQGTMGTVLNEKYSKVGVESKNYPFAITGNLTLTESKQPLRLGSSWFLECFSNHGFHYHSFSEQEPELSFRRVLFFSDNGFTIELFPIDFITQNVSGHLEKYVLSKPSFVELEFDGKLVHRFRPINQGRLFAYSVHVKDLSESEHAAKTQTHAIEVDPSENIVEFSIFESSV